MDDKLRWDLVDIRPHALRLAQGRVPGPLHVERNVLEWRFDPRFEAQLPRATGHDLHLIVGAARSNGLRLAGELRLAS